MLEFRLLGPIAIRDDTVELAVPGRGQQLLLGFLLVHHDQFAPVDQLVDAVWPAGPPATAHQQLRDRIRLLRKLLGQCPSVADPTQVLTTYSGGYRLTATATDAERFRLSADAGGQALRNGDVRHAATSLQSALRMWRGRPLAGIEAVWTTSTVAGLTERRWTAMEDWLAAALLLGRHHEVASETARIIAEQPLRERSWHHHLTALAELGRTAEALQRYERLRRLLSEELGIEPGWPLRELHHRLLQGYRT